MQACSRHSGKRQRHARQSDRQALGAPTVAAGRDRRVGHVLRLALVAHRCSDGGNSNLAVATIKALHLRLGLRWGLSACWHWGPLVERKDAFWAKGPARSQDRHEKSWEIVSCRRPPAPAQQLHWLADCERRLNPRGLFQLNYIPPTTGLTANTGILQRCGVMKLRYSCHSFQGQFG